MGLVAASMFVALFLYYEDIVGRIDLANLQLVMFAAFVFGIVCGYQVKKKRRN